MIEIAVTGGREFGMKPAVNPLHYDEVAGKFGRLEIDVYLEPKIWRALDVIWAKIIREQGLSVPVVMLNGKCKTGFDLIAERWATNRGTGIIPMPADWKKYGRGAGPIRNQAMIDRMPAALIAAPGGRGVAGCVAHAEKQGIPIYRIDLSQPEGVAA